MNIELIGFILDTVGKIMVSYTAVRVHYRFWREHKIDESVFVEMKKEQRLGIVGIALIIIGFLMELPSKI